MAPEGATEQFPLPESGSWGAEPSPDDGDSGTALLSYPEPEGAYDPSTHEADPYAVDYYDDAYEAGYGGEVEDYDDGYGDSYDDPYADDDVDADDDELPAGMASDDYAADGLGDEEPPEKTPAKEWLVLGSQVGAGLIAGGLVWFGFQWLWMAIPVAALVAALVVTGVLVLVARKILRTDDLQTILLAVLVGLVCTVSPAALLLVGY